MKTKFEEIWSEINYTKNYDLSKIRFWYLNDNKLDPLYFDEILKKQEGMLQIYKNPDDEYITEIPIYRVYVISYRHQILLDRREGNPQVDSMEIDLFTKTS